MENVKDCSNCHIEHKHLPDCWDYISTTNCRNWQPETNGDKVRQMTDDELAELWGQTMFPEKYHAGCEKCEKNESCEFLWYACPETFRNWLKAPAEESEK